MMSSTGAYVETIHWATARDGFESILTIFNYLGFAFGNLAPERTDAELAVRFFCEDGHELTPYKGQLPTGRSLHLPVGQIHPSFQGIVTVAMTPHGRMERRSARPGVPQRPIATSFFMLYERAGGFCDMSHELFIALREPNRQPVEWATVLFMEDDLDPAVVVMNNRPFGKEPDCQADIALRLFDLDGTAATEAMEFRLPPGGSRIVRLGDAFPAFIASGRDRVIATVTGCNIEQPMSFHRHASGDFNLHHF
jgi:hypothetical protein